MRRIVLFLMATLFAVILLFGYRTSTGGTVAAAPLTSATSPTSGSTSGTSGTSGAGASGSGGSGDSGTTPTASKTYDGSVASTRWGDVQVQITVSGGKVTAASAVEVPSGNPRDVEINDYAVPILDQEVVEAQSANIDAVSGATVTSDGYITSLQAALDKAGL